MWNYLAGPLFDAVELTGLKAGQMLFHSPKLLAPFLFATGFCSTYFIIWVGIVGLGSPN